MKIGNEGRNLFPRWILFSLFLTLCFLVFSPNLKAAITGKIAGVVVNARTGEPLPGANVIIEGTDRGAACDENGYYYIIRLDPGTYNVQARMMGYKSVTKTKVLVTSDHTTTLNFELEPAVVEGEGVVVEAQREVIKLDLSSSSFSATKSDIEAVPLITDVAQYLNLQAGIDGWSIRGGSRSETKLMADGLLLVDQRANEPILMPNLSEIKEVNLIKGGFAAEYANVTAGVINVVTREGSPTKYEGSFEYRYTKGYQKHCGPSIFSPDNYYNKSFLFDGDVDGDGIPDSVCWKGTTVWKKKGDTISWKTYPSFTGWITEAKKLKIKTTPEELRDRFLWMRRIDIPRTDSLLLIYNGGDSMYAPIYRNDTLIGYEKVPYSRKHEERRGHYGDKPDWTADVGFGGPIPLIGKALGNMSFYTSYRDHNETFAIPDSRDYYRERTASLKLTSRLGNVKASLRSAYSITNTLSPWSWGWTDPLGNLAKPHGFNGQVYLRSGMDIILPNGEWDGIYHGSDKLSLGILYRPNGLTPFDVIAKMTGISLQHAINENTFYDIHLTYIRRDNDAKFYYGVPHRMGGDTVVLWFGEQKIGSQIAVDNIPFGWADPDYEPNYLYDAGGAGYGSSHQLGTWNTSWSQTYSLSFDFTSQINKYNQMKTGFSYQYDKLHEFWISNDGWVWPDSGQELTYSGQQYCYNTSDAYPILIGGYIQDKIEFEGMFANLGLRFDYADPNVKWPKEEDVYSLYYSAYMKKMLFSEGAPLEDVPGIFKISPRVGISFPILERSKLFFSYGHFYSLPPNDKRFRIDWGEYKDPILTLGNPYLDMERTISYEVGLESSIANTYLARISGYYKDADKKCNDVEYESYYGDANYKRPENTGYSDIRGFEIEFRKDIGRFLRGWLNYDYRVETSGKIGLDKYFEDPVKQSQSSKINPEEARPVPRPVFRAQLTLSSPDNWGIIFGGYNFTAVYSWRAGRYETWIPETKYDPYRDELENNIQWPDERNMDISIGKNLSIAGFKMDLFMDVHNVFDWQELSTQAFSDDIDRKAYLKSLHLDIYNKPPLKGDPTLKGPEEGEEPDRVGDLRSEDKPYINNPNREFLYYLDPRFIQFGIRVSF